MTFSDLPTVNAILNGAAASLLVAGFVLIRAGRREAHRRAMTAAFACSVLFLVSYLVYHFEAGSVRFQGTGPVRTFYLTVLLTHTVLAAVVPFLAVTTLVLARKERFEAHRRLARVTLPIWLYVSVTGVVIYLMLYRMGF
ncbi:MAG TPA: DUF420 domain-containing protein [Thermoanaerobaculia bacterium]|nr:DUF420 domain-containing protein [Thermoanaerobaculia bacterium]